MMCFVTLDMALNSSRPRYVVFVPNYDRSMMVRSLPFRALSSATEHAKMQARAIGCVVGIDPEALKACSEDIAKWN